MKNIRELIIEDVKDFDLAQTFDCGQCFRWRRMPDGGYRGVAYGRAAEIRQEASAAGAGIRLVIKVAGGFEKDEDRELAFWRYYLDLDRDYAAIKAELARRDDKIGAAIRAGEGIHILHQETWETIVSFIISQNNNIPRIQGCIEKLAQMFGEPAAEEAWNLPEPKVLAGLTVEELAPVRLGYRAKYLIETARQVVAAGGLPTSDELDGLCGVGPKVASCIRLFGLGDVASFPIDVWVKRVMHEVYGFDEGDVKGMADFASRTFGEFGGIAQQYLFYAIRSGAVE